MSAICYILGHKEEVDPAVGIIYCERCGVWVWSGGTNPDLQASLELGFYLRRFWYWLPRPIYICEKGHVARIFGREIGNHDDCDIPF